jgi:hypothetical protein
MPLSALKRVITPDGIPSTEIEINSDILSEIGIKRGSTIDYIPFDERFKKWFYHIKIKHTEDEYIANICFHQQPVVVRCEDNEYDLSEIEILAVIIEKPKLRLIPERR